MNVKDQRGGQILLARHGRTQWNVERRRLGRTDIPLDGVGREQAAALPNLLADEFIDYIFSSPLVRARETAAPIARLRGVAVQTDDDLVEFDYGMYSGTLRHEAKLRLAADHLHVPVRGGESLTDAWSRAVRFASRVLPAAASGSHVLVVGHTRQQRLLAGVFEGRTLEETMSATSYKPANGSVLALRVAANRQVVERRLLIG